MALVRSFLLCLVLVLLLMVQATADTNPSEPSEQEKSAGSPVESVSDGEAEAPIGSNRKLGKHHSSDKSMAGGGVIIGGLVTAIFAAVFCYIRVTRRKPAEITAHVPGK